MRCLSYSLVATLLAAVLFGGGGCCAPGCCLPANSVWAFQDCDVLEPLDALCDCAVGCRECCECGEPVGCDRPSCAAEEIVCCDRPMEPSCLPYCRPLERGPPPLSYQPPRPPEFLPVPTRSVFTPLAQLSPLPRQATVEVGYGPQLISPSRD